MLLGPNKALRFGLSTTTFNEWRALASSRSIRPHYFDDEPWRQHAEHFLARQPYSEAAAQLIFMAYLQRVVNGGSPSGVPSIDREYAVGSGRIDLCVRWPLASGEFERFAVELKVRRDREPDPLDQGLEQLAAYLDRLGLDEGTLLLFDRRSEAPALPDRIERSETEHGSRRIVVWRL